MIGQLTTTTSLYAAMEQFFKEDQWPSLLLDGRTVLTMNFEGQNAKWTCYAQAREEQQQFIFYSLCPINAPTDKRAAVAEYLTRANYGLVIGNFEMDLEDGEIRYKTSFDCENIPLTSALFKNVVYPNVFMMDRYLPGILAIVYSEAVPVETVESNEG